jgi:transposase
VPRGAEKKDHPREPVDHALGRSRGGFSTKVHLVCDGQGNPLHFELTAGQAHEVTAFTKTLNHADIRDLDNNTRVWPARLAGDKAYRAQWIIDWLEKHGIAAVIPAKGTRGNDHDNPGFDREAYRQRNIVERLVGWLKECRRVFSRYEKTAINFAGMITIALIQRYLRLFCPE